MTDGIADYVAFVYFKDPLPRVTISVELKSGHII
jgi:hypothetical protein